jgi:tetratricopeptide (TPR) repeat protein
MDNANAMKAQQRLMQAIQTYQVGDLSSAEKELRDLLKSFPKSDQIMAVLAAVLFSQKKYKESYRQYREANSINPENVEAAIGIASAEHARGNVENAIKLMGKALEKFPDRLEAHFNLGTFYITQKDLGKAEACFLKSLELEPKLVQADLHLVNIYMEWKQYGKAEHHLRKVIAANPDPQLKAKLKEIVDLREGSDETEPVAAKPVASEYAAEPSAVRKEDSVTDVFGIEEGDLNGLLSLATAFLERHQYKEAREYYEKVLAIDDKNLVATTALRKIKSASIPLWHFEMLADHGRNDAYQQAIESALKRRPGARVLDIGTGSGLLAMMAARAGASEVLACEMNSELAQVATRIVEDNGYKDQIKILNLKSNDLRPGLDYEGKYDLVVSEILDVAGIGEGVLPSLRHAFENLLKPGAITVPAGITMCAQLVAAPAFYSVNPIKEVSGFDLSAFNEFRPPDEYLPIRMNTLEHEALSPPVAFHFFDFSNIPETRPNDNPHVLEVDFTINKRGNVQAVVFWFDLHLDEELILSSGPGGKLKHWGQAICFMKDQIAVKPGTSLAMEAKYSDVTMWFEPLIK